MDWYEITDNYHGWAIGSRDDLLALPHEWQRELAAIWRRRSRNGECAYSLLEVQKWGKIPAYSHRKKGCSVYTPKGCGIK